MTLIRTTLQWVVSGALAAQAFAQDGAAADFERALSLAKRTENKLFRAGFKVNWHADGKYLSYRVQTGAVTWEYVQIELESGEMKRSSDAGDIALQAQTLTTSEHATLAVRPSRSTGAETQIRFVNAMPESVELFWVEPTGQRRSYGRVAPGETKQQHTFAEHVWLITGTNGELLGAVEAKADPLKIIIDGKGRATPQNRRRSNERDHSSSPDGRWTVRFENHQVVLHDGSSGETLTLTTNGTAAQPYRGRVSWAPDGQSFVTFLVKEVEPRKITVVESSPQDQLQPKVRVFDYQKPGDELPRPRPVLFRLSDREPLLINDELFPNAFTPEGRLSIRWSPGSDEFYFDYNERGHQLYRVLAVNTETAAVRTVVEEKAQTFVDYTNKTWRHWLDARRELLWMSERDGWCHLWLYDAATGSVKAQVTRGTWVVRKVERVDEEKEQVWFLASGLRAGEDPYHQHLCRVNLDGSGFVQLTKADGNHEIAFSPNWRFFVATWSRADHPPVAELRRSDDGELVCELERADASALLESGWSMPERFVARGRDGKTEIHGVIVKPSNFDPARKYPVLEEVYAGPHGVFSPKSFGRMLRHHALAELGFIVVQADGMGTNHRGKAFHDVAWKNLQDAGFPDRIAWIKAAADANPAMDLSRVGIYGGSAGGQSAMRALLDHHEFYKAAFADCGCHDNRMDKIWWNEQWLGWPVDDAYVRSSNVVDAAKLQGALMLCVGELDRNVDPASTMQAVRALQQAGKHFDLVVIAGTGHGAAETPYGSRRRMDFFVRHLGGPSAKP